MARSFGSVAIQPDRGKGPAVFAPFLNPGRPRPTTRSLLSVMTINRAGRSAELFHAHPLAMASVPWALRLPGWWEMSGPRLLKAPVHAAESVRCPSSASLFPGQVAKLARGPLGLAAMSIVHVGAIGIVRTRIPLDR